MGQRRWWCLFFWLWSCGKKSIIHKCIACVAHILLFQLFKHLLNQLRYWSLNPLVTRVLSPPRDLKNEFISLCRCLKFDERFLSDTFSEKVNSNVKIIDNQRLCVKTGEDQHCAYVTGNLLYFQGKHLIKLMVSLTKQRIGFIGIRPANLPIQVNSTKNYLPIPSTFGVDNDCLVLNGQCALIGQAWTTVCPTNNFQIELDCDSRTMYIIRCQSFGTKEYVVTRFIDLTLAPFPWQLFIVLKDKNDYLRLLLWWTTDIFSNYPLLFSSLSLTQFNKLELHHRTERCISVKSHMSLTARQQQWLNFEMLRWNFPLYLLWHFNNEIGLHWDLGSHPAVNFFPSSYLTLIRRMARQVVYKDFGYSHIVMPIKISENQILRNLRSRVHKGEAILTNSIHTLIPHPHPHMVRSQEWSWRKRTFERHCEQLIKPTDSSLFTETHFSCVNREDIFFSMSSDSVLNRSKPLTYTEPSNEANKNQTAAFIIIAGHLDGVDRLNKEIWK